MGLALKAFFIGIFAVIKRWKLLVLLFGLNFLCSTFLALPLYRVFSEDLGRAGGVMERLARFDPRLLADFFRRHHESAEWTALAAGAGGILYFLLLHFLSAGVLSILAEPREKTSLETLLAGCGRFAFRFLRLLFYFAVALVVLAGLNRLADRVVDWYFRELRGFAAGSASLGWILFAKNLLALGLVGLAVVSWNFAKIAVVKEGGHFTGGHFIRGWAFTLSHPLVTGIFFLASTALFFLPLVLYGWLSRTIDLQGSYTVLRFAGGVTLSGVTLFFLLAQALQLLVQAALLHRWAGQVYLFQYLTVQAAPADPELSVRPSFAPHTFIVDRPFPETAVEAPPPEQGGSPK